jgi:hypothetical protein
MPDGGCVPTLRTAARLSNVVEGAIVDHGFTSVGLNGDRLHQLSSQRKVPCWSHARLFHVELPAQQLYARLAPATDRGQQPPK